MPVRLIVAAIASAIVLALAGWWHLGQVKQAERAVHAHYAVVLADIRDKTAAAQAKFRATETAWQTRIEKETRDGQDRIDTARRDAAGARAAADSLRADLARYRAAARATAHSSAAAAGPPADTAIDLLAELFGGADTRAGELAEFAYLAHAAGLTCERAFDALTAETKP